MINRVIEQALRTMKVDNPDWSNLDDSDLEAEVSGYVEDQLRRTPVKSDLSYDDLVDSLLDQALKQLGRRT